MPQDHVHDFYEVPVFMPNGEKLFVTGKFNISYTMQPADPDVGIRSAYPEFDPTDDFVTVTAFDERDSLDGEDMTITLPWLPGSCHGNFDVLGQIWHKQHDRIADEIMEIEDDE